MTDYVYDPRKINDEPLKVTVTAGTSKTVGLRGDTRGLGVVAAPGGSGSALIETTLNTWAEIDATTATWIPWSHGTVTTDADDSLAARRVMGLKLTATTANADFWVG